MGDSPNSHFFGSLLEQLLIEVPHAIFHSAR